MAAFVAMVLVLSACGGTKSTTSGVAQTTAPVVAENSSLARATPPFTTDDDLSAVVAVTPAKSTAGIAAKSTPKATAKATVKKTTKKVTKATSHAVSKTTATKKTTTSKATKTTSSGNVVHPGAFCSRNGAKGVTTKGTPMRCQIAKDRRLRWKAA